MELTSLLLVSAVVTAIVEIVKTKLGSSGWRTIIALALTSLVASGLWSVFKDTDLWPRFMEVLLYANAIYTLLVKQLQS